MLWVLYSLLSAFSWATADTFTKKIFNVDEYILMLARFFYGIPFVLLLFFIPIPALDASFWSLLLFWIPIEALLWVLYIKAIRSSPLSLVAPLISLTPVFLIFTSFIIRGLRLFGFFQFLF